MKIKIYPPQTIYETGKRDNQEDAISPALGNAAADEHVFVLCDGMGGHEHGEVASQTVCSAIYDYIHRHWPDDNRVGDQLILDAIQTAYDALDAKDSDTGKKMGTTLTLVVLHEGGCTAAHIGDSRIYHLRTAEQRLLYRSRDHSLVADLYQAGEISYEEMATSPQKNIITKAMQPGEDNRVRPDIVHIGNLRAGDYLYLCSDGMMEQMDDTELTRLLCAKESDADKRQRLIKETAGNSDNHSAHLIQIREVEMDEDEAVVDDEGTVRCNFLNIRPAIAEAEVVETSPQMEDRTKKPLPVQKGKKDRMWVLLPLAVILALILYAWLSMGSDKDDLEEPEQEELMQNDMKDPVEFFPQDKVSPPDNASESSIHEIEHNRSDKHD